MLCKRIKTKEANEVRKSIKDMKIELNKEIELLDNKQMAMKLEMKTQVKLNTHLIWKWKSLIYGMEQCKPSILAGRQVE